MDWWSSSSSFWKRGASLSTRGCVATHTHMKRWSTPHFFLLPLSLTILPRLCYMPMSLIRYQWVSSKICRSVYLYLRSERLPKTVVSFVQSWLPHWLGLSERRQKKTDSKRLTQGLNVPPPSPCISLYIHSAERPYLFAQSGTRGFFLLLLLLLFRRRRLIYCACSLLARCRTSFLRTYVVVWKFTFLMTRWSILSRKELSLFFSSPFWEEQRKRFCDFAEMKTNKFCESYITWVSLVIDCC